MPPGEASPALDEAALRPLSPPRPSLAGCPPSPPAPLLQSSPTPKAKTCQEPVPTVQKTQSHPLLLGRRWASPPWASPGLPWPGGCPLSSLRPPPAGRPLPTLVSECARHAPGRSTCLATRSLPADCLSSSRSRLEGPILREAVPGPSPQSAPSHHPGAPSYPTPCTAPDMKGPRVSPVSPDPGLHSPHRANTAWHTVGT